MTILSTTASLLGAGLMSASVASATLAADKDAVRELFERQVQAENAHDIAGFAAALAPNTPEFSNSVVLVTRAGVFHGYEAVVRRFDGYFKGSWKLEPDWGQISIAPLGADTYHLLAPTRITLGAPGKEPQTLPFLINEIAVRTADGWRFTTLVPVLQQ
jgi:hypothetical protein